MLKRDPERKKLIKFLILVILAGHVITSFLIPAFIYYPNFNLEMFIVYSRYYVIICLVVVVTFFIIKMAEEFQVNKEKKDEWE